MKKSELIPSRIMFMRQMVILYSIWWLALGLLWLWMDIRNWDTGESSANGAALVFNIVSLLGLVAIAVVGVILSLVNTTLEARAERSTNSSQMSLLIFITLPILLIIINS